MGKHVAFLIIGALIGAGIGFSVLRGDGAGAGFDAVPGDPAASTLPVDGERLPESEQFSPADLFAREGDRIEALAERDPAQAVADAMARGSDSLKRVLLIRAGEGAARRDPVAALAQAAAMTDLELRSGLTLGILNAWAALDPVGMLDYLEAVEPDYIRSPIPFDRLVLGDPEGLLNRLDDFDGVVRRSLERAALLALAETDAIGTLARLEDMAPGAQRMELTLLVADTYGRQDPGAALAWVMAQNPPSQAALSGVVNGIATVDINRALDWVLRETASPTVAGLNAAEALSTSSVFQGLRAGVLPMPQTADRLLASGNATLKNRATSALMVWAQSNAADAVNYAVERIDQFEPDDLTVLAMQTADSAPDVAAQTAGRLPPEYRATWVAGVADALVRTRPQRALDYLAGQRGQPGYSEGVVAVVRQLAPADPATAATLVTDSPPSPQIANAARIVAAAWTSDNAVNARQWVLGLPAGETRDAGISGVLTAQISAGEFDSALLAAMSSDASRQDAASSAILQIGRTDQARARELMQAHITDDTRREQLEQQLAQLARLSATGAMTPRLPTFTLPEQGIP